MAPASMATIANSHTMMVRQHRSSESSLPPAVSHQQVGRILQHKGKKTERWGRLQLEIDHDKFGVNSQHNASKTEHVNSLQTAVDHLSNGSPPPSTINSNPCGAKKLPPCAFESRPIGWRVEEPAQINRRRDPRAYFLGVTLKRRQILLYSQQFSEQQQALEPSRPAEEITIEGGHSEPRINQGPTKPRTANQASLRSDFVRS